MIAGASAPTSGAERAAARLRTVSLALVAAMPLAMAVANRSSVLFLTVSALFAASAALMDGKWRSALLEARSALSTSLGRAGLGFLALSLTSIFWSEVPATSLHAFGEFALSLAAALAVGVLVPRPWPAWAFRGLALCFALACALILIELATGLMVRRELGMRWNSFIFNRSTLTLLVLAPAIFWILWRERRPLPRAVGIGLGLVFAWVLLSSESGAAVFGAAAALAAAAIALLPRRLAIGLAGAGIVSSLLLAPAQGDLAAYVLPSRTHETLASSNSQSRVAIWQSFGAAARSTPWLGSGFGTSARLERTSVTTQVPPEHRILLGAGHPHNAALQIWVELGLIGAAMALLVSIRLLQVLNHLPPYRFVPALALLGAVSAVSLVGHGAWQGWWAAAIGTGVLALRGARPGGLPAWP